MNKVVIGALLVASTVIVSPASADSSVRISVSRIDQFGNRINQSRVVRTDAFGDRVVGIRTIRIDPFGNRVVRLQSVRSDPFGDRIVRTRTWVDPD